MDKYMINIRLLENNSKMWLFTTNTWKIKLLIKIKILMVKIYRDRPNISINFLPCQLNSSTKLTLHHTKDWENKSHSTRIMGLWLRYDARFMGSWYYNFLKEEFPLSPNWVWTLWFLCIVYKVVFDCRY